MLENFINYLVLHVKGHASHEIMFVPFCNAVFRLFINPPFFPPFFLAVTFSRRDPEGKLLMGFRKASNTMAMQVMGFAGVVLIFLE